MRILLPLIAAFGLVAGVLSVAQPVDSPAPLKAGVAQQIITPAMNMWMAGYASRKKPAEGKVQELYAKALALEDVAGKRFVFVTLDLIGILPRLRMRMEEKVQNAYGLPPESILLNASHTHSGPEYRVEKGREKEAREYTAFLEERLMKVIGDALTDLKPAAVSWSHSRCGFAMNRRLPSPTGYQNSPNPEGPVDHEVPVLQVVSPEGQARAVLFGYACHNTCLGEFQYCGDYAGFAQEYLQENRPGFVALFMNGCSGDQNPYPRRGGVVPGLTALDLAKMHGRSLSNAVEVAMQVPKRVVGGRIRAAYEKVSLDYAPEKKRAPHLYPVQVARFGEALTVVALGSETTVDYSIRLKKELSNDSATWVAGYSNDYTGYVPSLRVLKEGGYEAQAGWAEDVEERIVKKVHEWVEETQR
ncbi:MAG: neutral/alkaline non-lysosomal ceramidase N-terminal domain-containing protein [Verrucomicrobiaceae bacterium]|nr:neutral/alkaline non-lysosomal ceramidase N-terminal domain-containing protein [Verrucomicrobiaceae bacterium]